MMKGKEKVFLNYKHFWLRLRKLS